VFRLKNSPVEVTHFLEYGVLSFFIFKALSHHIKNQSIYFSATLITLIFGILDEVIQWIVPGRVWNFKDVGMNAVSGALIQLAIWKVIAPKSISKRINLKSLRIFSSLFMTCIIIIGLCASNSPHRVYSYSKHISFLDFLQKEEPMGEFGYKYKDPKIGIFYSRLSPKKLRRTDEINGEKYGQILNKSVKMKYKEFLHKYNPITNPFLYELRVHIFRRDRYFSKGEKKSNGSEGQKFYYVAYKENLILQKYFTNTIKQSIYWWGKDKMKKVKMEIDEGKRYKSPVSSNLFTGFSQKSMWISIFILIVIIGIINLILAFRKPKINNQTG